MSSIKWKSFMMGNFWKNINDWNLVMCVHKSQKTNTEIIVKLLSMYFFFEGIRAKFYQQWIPSNLYRGANFYANKHTLKRWQMIEIIHLWGLKLDKAPKETPNPFLNIVWVSLTFLILMKTSSCELNFQFPKEPEEQKAFHQSHP